MKKLYSVLIVASLLLAIMPMVMAVSVGSGITPTIEVEEFPPRVWMCDHRVVMDDNTEPGRVDFEIQFAQKVEICEDLDGSGTIGGVDLTIYCSNVCAGVINNPATNATNETAACNTACIAASATLSATAGFTVCPILKGPELLERLNNYAFEGEKIEWKVLVMDKNKIDQNIDVYATIGDSQGEGNDIEVNCVRLNNFANPGDPIMPECNARIQEEHLTTFDDQIMSYFECTLTVETPESMYGQYWITVEATDASGLSGTMAENEYWFLNPVIALSIDGDMEFTEVRPGTDAYSSTMLVGNDADDSSGVLLDMFISGTDFYDSSSSGARCSITNQLLLNNFRYYATSGAYSTQNDFENDCNGGIVRDRDAEGYVNIDYGIGFNNPRPFYNAMEIIQAGGVDSAALAGACGYDSLNYYPGNVLAPGAEMAITFKLSLPEPCVGNFDSGSIYFWGEAI